MTIHLNVTSDLERQLRKVADQMGLTLDTYIMRLLQKDLRAHTAPAQSPRRRAYPPRKANY